MNPIDVVVLVILGAFALFGLRRGFVHGMLDLVIVALTLLAASRIYPMVVEPAVARGLPRSLASPVAFIVLFGILVFVVSGLVGLLLRPLARMWVPAPARWADTLLGVVPGAIKGLALATVVVVPLIFYQGLFGLGGAVAQSRLAAPLLQWGLPAVYGALGRLGVDTTDFAAVTSPPSEGTIALPFRITDGLAPDPAGEQQMLQLVNQARVRDASGHRSGPPAAGLRHDAEPGALHAARGAARQPDAPRDRCARVRRQRAGTDRRCAGRRCRSEPRRAERAGRACRVRGEGRRGALTPHAHASAASGPIRRRRHDVVDYVGAEGLLAK